MKKSQCKKHSFIFIFVFMVLFIFSFSLIIDSYANPQGGHSTDIDVERLTKTAASAKPKIDAITRPNSGADGLAVNPGAPPNLVAPVAANAIPAGSIVAELPVDGQPVVGSAVKVRVKPGFSFGNGNIRNASLVWKTSDEKISQTIQLFVQGGMVNNFSGALYEFKPQTGGAHSVHFEINYKLFGDDAKHTSVSAPKTIVFATGAAGPNPGDNPGNPGQPGVPGFVPPPPGVNTLPGTISKQIPINFSRSGGPPEIREREEYSWKWEHAQLQHPSANPGKAYNYVVASIKRGAEMESNDDQGVAQIAPDEADKYVEHNGTFYRKGGIDIDGDGPLPDSLQAKWEVRYPSVTPGGAGGWNVIYNLQKGTGQGDEFKYSMPEPSEPFKVIVAMKVEHIWREYSYVKAPSQIGEAIQFYNALKNNQDPTGSLNGSNFRNVQITVNAPSCSGGAGQVGPSFINVTVSGKATYQEYKKVGEREVTNDKGEKHKEDIMDWVNGSKTIAKPFDAGKTVHNDEAGKLTDESVVHEKVLDTTAPKLEFAPQAIGGLATLTGTGDIICSSGDLINVRVKVSDNNKYSALRTPYLTYETAPSGNNPNGATWSGVPLSMEPCPGVPDNLAARPFANGNWGYYQALVPAPHNIKGTKALRWFVDAFDGSGFKQPQSFNGSDCFGNFNHGNFEFDGIANNTHKVEASPDKYGTLTIYDNDRPNIDVKMWKVDRTGIYLVGEFEASEDYFTEDFYYDLTNPANIIDPSGPAGEFKAKIPADTAAGNVHAASSLLGVDSAGMQVPGALIFPNTALFPLERKMPIAQNLKFQIEDAPYNFFKYQAGYGVGAAAGLKDGNCPVVFEDVKYIFTVNAYDNIEGIANNGVVTIMPKPERTRLSFEFKDTASQPQLGAVNMEFRQGQSGPVTSAAEGKLWYLGPEDPSIPLAAGTAMLKEVPTFEHVFHSVSKDDSVGSRSLKITAADRCGHKRNIAIHFKVSEVTNELRVLEEKIKRELKQQRDKM